MNGDAEFNEAITIIDRQIEKALSDTHRFRDIWGNGRLRSHRGFGILVQPSQEEIEHEFFRSSQEYSIRWNIVNPILSSLFVLYGIEADWPKETIVFKADNIRHERTNPVEFVIARAYERVGYRYTVPDSLTSDDVNCLLNDYDIARLVVVDWSGTGPEALRQSGDELCIGGSEYITRITAEEFFDELFPVELYDEFVGRVRSAVRRAEEIEGYQTVSSLSIPRLAPFRVEMFDGIRKVVDGLPDRHEDVNGKETYRLSKVDRAILDRAFFQDGWGRSLGGTRGFARCLETSEYLQNVFRTGGEFDYTAIVCGYLKAVEQLANELMLATLGTPGSESLYIATFKRGNRFPPNHRAFGWSRDEPHVPFAVENKKYFKTTLVAIANLLHDNEGAWRISDEGRHFVLLRIRTFANRDRNGYFHKDNFTDYNEVQKIREDAISILYYLVGGYSIPGGRDRQLRVLGMENVTYDDMYLKLSEIRIENFVLEFEEEGPIKAIRLFKQPPREYDEYGLVKSKVYFVRVKNHRGHHEWESVETVDKTSVFEVSREHMPSKMWYVKYGGSEVRFW